MVNRVKRSEISDINNKALSKSMFSKICNIYPLCSPFGYVKMLARDDNQNDIIVDTPLASKMLDIKVDGVHPLDIDYINSIDSLILNILTHDTYFEEDANLNILYIKNNIHIIIDGWEGKEKEQYGNGCERTI